MPRLVDDQALREAFRRGEREALAEVYREYARPVFALFAAGFTLDGGRRFKGFAARWEKGGRGAGLNSTSPATSSYATPRR